MSLEKLRSKIYRLINIKYFDKMKKLGNYII